MNPPKRESLVLVALFFVLSGAASLVDQVCFSKYLSYVVGATAEAVSAVLAAFMAGLALGAFAGGRFASRVRRPLLAYGVLELGVAASVAVSPALFAGVGELYFELAQRTGDSGWLLAALRWIAAFSVVLIPTTMMGATLPLLSRLVEFLEVARERRIAIGVLYAANTLGGAVGALGSVYLVLPRFGLQTSTLLAAAASALVGVAAIAYGYRRARSPSETVSFEASDASHRNLPDWLFYFLALASGALVLGSEVLFVHLLVLIVGTSAYAFGVIIAIFLICLFLGASLAPVFGRIFGRYALSVALVASAGALAITLGGWERLPDMFRGMGGSADTFASREWVRGLAAFSALVLPATAMGLTFPLLLQIAAERQNTGRLVGRMTAVNTLGSVFGSLAFGYWILPRFGSQVSIVLTASLFAGAGLLVLAHVPSPPKRAGAIRWSIALAALAVVGLGVGTTPWDLTRMTGGYHVYFDWGRGPEDILFVEEDTQGGVTTVTEKDGVLTLLTNGKFQGNNGDEVHAQRFFAHYPLMFVRSYDRALIIGLGTGTTLGTVAAYPFAQVDVAEISQTIVRAAKRYFGPLGADALDEPRVTLMLEDGRNHIAVTQHEYDLIGIELTSVWFAGAGSLYSQEFYALVRQRLKPEGVFQQWVQMHHLRDRDLAVVIHTLRTQFAHVALFYGGGQGILVASNAPLKRSVTELRALETALGSARPSRPLETLTVDVLAETHGLDAFILDTARREGVDVSELLSTDDNLYLEYATPKGNVLPWSSREELVARLRQYRNPSEIDSLITR